MEIWDGYYIDGTLCRIIKTYFSDMTNEEFFHYTLKNCKLEEYHI